MEKEKIRKIWKRVLIIVVLLAALFIMSFGWILAIGATQQLSERRMERESSVYYMLGKGCSQSYEMSEEKLKKEVEFNINCCVSKKRLKQIISEISGYKVKELTEYNSKDSLNEEEIKEKNKSEKCLIVTDRIEKIVNDLK
jgi:cytochrome b involved in lipid metabolism